MRTLLPTPALKLAAFAAALAVVFGVAAVAGGAIGPEPKAAAGGHAMEHGGGHATASHDVRGLAIAEDGLRLVVDRTRLRRNRTERLTFRIVDDGGDTVRDFDVLHERRMHLILARRDLTGFQHLHPVQAADGAWSVAVRIPQAGSYRMFADFATAGAPHTLAADLRVDGTAVLRDLPAPAPVAGAGGGLTVSLDDGGDALRFSVSHAGVPVAVEPYLGASGHLVALREGDLAFLHVHPTEDGAFETEFPTPGRYRLFLQVKVAGTVHTAAFTKVVR